MASPSNWSAISADRVRELLDYDPETGQFTYRVKPRNCGRGDGIHAGGRDKGYIRVNVDGITVRAHRLAWLYVTGAWPENLIDHINGVGADNRWVNLREATNAENSQNSRRARNNTSGYKGVTQAWWSGRWVAQIWVNGKNRHLGTFDTPQEAHAAYVAEAAIHHRQFANDGTYYHPIQEAPFDA